MQRVGGNHGTHGEALRRRIGSAYMWCSTLAGRSLERPGLLSVLRSGRWLRSGSNQLVICGVSLDASAAMSIPEVAAWSFTIRLISQLRERSSRSRNSSRYSKTPGSNVTPAGVTVLPVVGFLPRAISFLWVACRAPCSCHWNPGDFRCQPNK